MKALLLIFSIFLSFEAFSLTPEEAEEQRVDRRRKRLDKTVFTPESTEKCDEATKLTKQIHGLILDKKSAADGEKSLIELEQDYEKKKSELVIYNGIKKLNDKYKDFLTDVAGVDGWKAPPGVDGEGLFSIKKFKEDIAASQVHLENVDTMAFMDAMLKDTIENHKDLVPDADLDEEQRKEILSQKKIDYKSTGVPIITPNVSGSKVFKQYEDFCNGTNAAKSPLCNILKGSTSAGKKKIRQSVIGFVDAYRTSQRKGIKKKVANFFIGDDLANYRKSLLEGIELSSPELLKNEIQVYRESNKDLLLLSRSKGALDSVTSDLNRYHACVTARALAPGVGEDCVLEAPEKPTEEDKKNGHDKSYLEIVNDLAGVQHRVVESLGGDNSEASLKARMEKIHRHSEAKVKLEGLKLAYQDRPDFKELIDKKIKAKKDSVNGDVQDIMSAILANKNRSERAFDSKGGFRLKETAEAQVDYTGKSESEIAVLKEKAQKDKIASQKKIQEDAFQKYVTGKARIKAPTNEEQLGSLNNDLNQKMAVLLCADLPEKAPATDAEASTRGNCEESKKKSEDGFFKLGSKGNIEIAPEQLENYLNELNEGNLVANTDKSIGKLTGEMDNLKGKIDGLRSSEKYSTLNKLLAYYGNKAKTACQGFNGKELQSKELVTCDFSEDKSTTDNIKALLSSTGEILATMPNSPGNQAVTELNKECSTKFMAGFTGEQSKIIESVCDSILQDNERFVESVKPTEAEVRYKKEFSYWDGTKRVTQTRQRDRWMVTQAIAEGAIGFLPSYLDHQIKTTGIETWEASTIEGIKYRNGMLENYYTYGIYGNNGYFGGTPDYLSNWGGSVYNNGFQTVGAGGFFAFSEPTVAPVTAGSTSTSAGFSF